jgi:hypothetical protein
MTAELDCRATIDLVHMPPDEYISVLDAVALPGPEIPHEIGRIDNESGLGFAKAGLLVRPGTASAITVANLDHRIGWGSTDAAQRMDIPACDGGADWLVYAGGFLVPEPACLTLVVESGGDRSEIRIPIDAPCE